MRELPSRLRRLDAALGDLPLEEPMLLTELDGFLTGVLLCPEPIPPAEWMSVVWGPDTDGVPPFEDPLDVGWFADAVMAHLGAIGRDFARGRPRPIFDVDERNGDILWEIWAGGLDEAMALRPDAWAMIAGVDDALSQLSLLIAVARQESTLDSVEINALQDSAPGDLIVAVSRLYAARAPGAAAAEPPAKIGRNDPCVCGSGRKSKRCCG